jgi:hypothetical protein
MMHGVSILCRASSLAQFIRATSVFFEGLNLTVGDVPTVFLLFLSLPESEALPSVGFFAECLLSGTRQR